MGVSRFTTASLLALVARKAGGMTTPPHLPRRAEASGVPGHSDTETAAEASRRGLPGFGRSVRAGVFVLHGAAIGIAVLLAPLITGTMANGAVPRAVPAPVSTTASASPAPVTPPTPSAS